MFTNKSIMALLIFGIIVLAELMLIGVLSYSGMPVPEQAWSLVYATVGLLGGAAGAQAWNGYQARKGG